MDPEYSSDSLNALINGYRHIVVVDMEHTVEDGSIQPEERETIEIGAVLIYTCSLQLEDEYSELIRPITHPETIQFCTELRNMQINPSHVTIFF